MEQIKNHINLINSETLRLKFDKEPRELYEPIEYILGLGGKRARPLLCMLAYRLCGGFKKMEEVVQASLAVEVFHNFSLVHDDIMDKAPLRRGKHTVHEKWNLPIAILSGDAMLIEAYNLLLQAEVEDFKYLLSRFNKTAIEVCEGQQWDMNFETTDDVHEAQYIDMIRLKTAVLLGFSLEYGALMAGANSDIATSLHEIGTNIGIGFQLKDDLLDAYGDPSKFGKKIGGDIISNKKTFLLINALNLSNPRSKTELVEWIERKKFDEQEKIRCVKRIFDECSIREITEKKMNYFFTCGLEGLERLEFPDQQKSELIEYFRYLIERDR